MTSLLWICVCGLVVSGASAQGQQHSAVKKTSCVYEGGYYSPVYSTDLEYIVTDYMCESDPGLTHDCVYPGTDIQGALDVHTSITKEIDVLNRYFSAMIQPTPKSKKWKGFHCTEDCNPDFLPLKRVFHLQDEFSEPKLCHVIHPTNIYYAACHGTKCNLKEISGMENEPYYCMASTTFEMDFWVYCPNQKPNCIKKRMTLPLSCSCAKFQCKQALPIDDILPGDVVDPSMGIDTSGSGGQGVVFGEAQLGQSGGTPVAVGVGASAGTGAGVVFGSLFPNQPVNPVGQGVPHSRGAKVV